MIRKLISKEKIAKLISFYPVCLSSFIVKEQLDRADIVDRIYDEMSSGESKSWDLFFPAPGIDPDWGMGWRLNVECGRLGFFLNFNLPRTDSEYGACILDLEEVEVLKESRFGEPFMGYEYQVQYIELDDISPESFCYGELKLFDRAVLLDWHEDLFEMLTDLTSGCGLFISGRGGTGKTFAIDVYRKYRNTSRFFYASPDGSPDSLLEQLIANAPRMFFNGKPTKYEKWEKVIASYSREYLFIDNAHYLKASCYPYLKTLLDNGAAVVLIGNHSINSKLKSSDLSLSFPCFQVPEHVLAECVSDFILCYSAFLRYDSEEFNDYDNFSNGVEYLESTFEVDNDDILALQLNINIYLLTKLLDRYV